eukprot:m.87968 g.87968  ORF g.87968 m.87968 type:complete len:587 (+) comp14522_c0_seq1:227-1987(+)
MRRQPSAACHGACRHAARWHPSSWMMMMMMLLCVTQSSSVQAIAEPTCSSLLPQLNDVYTECGVTNLADLYRSSNYRGSTPYFCMDGCLAAVESLYRSLPFCVDADAILGTTQSLAQLRSIYFEQLSCNAPSIACLRTMRDFSRWQATSQGSSCMATLHGSRYLDVTQASQTRLASLCTSDCNAAFSFYLGQLESNQCQAWRAYKVYRDEYDTSCVRATLEPQAASSGTEPVYCRNQFSPEARMESLQVAQNLSQPFAERDHALGTICTPCFFAYLRTARQQNLFPFELAQLEQLCVRDRGTFCFPRFTDILSLTATSGPAQRAERLCELGHCASKMIARLRTTPELATIEAIGSEDVAANLALHADTHLQYMCAENTAADEVSGLTANYPCVEVTNSIVAGFDATLQYVGTPFSGPTACEGITSGDYCTWGCQRRFTTLTNNLGCCHNTVRSYFTELGISGEEIDTAFSSVETVAQECNRPLDHACILFNPDIAQELDISLPFPKSFLQQQQNALETDLITLIGRPEIGLEVVRISQTSAQASVVTVRLTFETTTRKQQVLASINADIAADTLVFQTLTPLYYGT